MKAVIRQRLRETDRLQHPRRAHRALSPTVTPSRNAAHPSLPMFHSTDDPSARGGEPPLENELAPSSREPGSTGETRHTALLTPLRLVARGRRTSSRTKGRPRPDLDVTPSCRTHWSHVRSAGHASVRPNENAALRGWRQNTARCRRHERAATAGSYPARARGRARRLSRQHARWWLRTCACYAPSDA